MSRLSVEALRYREYGPIDFAIPDGVCMSLTGPSGAGKTLLLRAIADLDPHAGRVLLDDVVAASLPAPSWRRQVAMLPAESAWWHESVGAHFGAVGTADTVPAERLALLGFSPDVMRWEIARLSTGERQRLAILRLLANDPRALLLDEPTANLDAPNVSAVESLIATFRHAGHAPVLWVTHDPDQRRRVASQHYRIDNGTVREEPTP